jgi:hypothetical protein
MAPNFGAGIDEREPENAPIGVLAADNITAFIFFLSIF